MAFDGFSRVQAGRMPKAIKMLRVRAKFWIS